MKKQYYKFLRYEDGKIVSNSGVQEWKVGVEYSVVGEIRRCKNGFHASETPYEAFTYVRGEILALVEVSGESDNDTDKICFRSMKIVKAAKAYLKDPNDKNKQAAIKTRNAAQAAAYAYARSKLRAKIGRFMKARIKKLKEL